MPNRMLFRMGCLILRKKYVITAHLELRERALNVAPLLLTVDTTSHLRFVDRAMTRTAAGFKVLYEAHGGRWVAHGQLKKIVKQWQEDEDGQVSINEDGLDNAAAAVWAPIKAYLTTREDANTALQELKYVVQISNNKFHRQYARRLVCTWLIVCTSQIYYKEYQPWKNAQPATPAAATELNDMGGGPAFDLHAMPIEGKVFHGVSMHRAIFGHSIIPPDFVIRSSEFWPAHLWGFRLGHFASRVRSTYRYVPDADDE